MNVGLDGHCLFLICLNYTLPKTNIAPTNGWLEYYFPIGEAYFQGQTVSFREGKRFNPITIFQRNINLQVQKVHESTKVRCVLRSKVDVGGLNPFGKNIIGITQVRNELEPKFFRPHALSTPVFFVIFFGGGLNWHIYHTLH